MRTSLVLCTLALAGTSAAQLPIPAFGRTYAATNVTRGFYFQTPVPIVVTGLRVPDEGNAGVQCVELSRLAAQPPAFSGNVVATQLFYNNNTPSGQVIPCTAFFGAGDWVCVLGACGTTTMNNSYATPLGPFVSNILGIPVTLTRLLTQTNLSLTGGNQPVSSEAAFEISRVEVFYQDGTGYASFSPYGQGCGGGGPPGIHELFTTAAPNDLSNSGITLIPNGASYIALQGSSPIVAPSGSPVVFGDDQTQAILLPGTFTHATGTTNTLWVCSNGWISLETTTLTTLGETVPLMQSGPARVYVWWDDLNPGVGGAMYAEQDPVLTSLFHVSWVAVPEYSIGGANTMQATFDLASGLIEIKWGTMSSLDGLVGYHPGHGADVPTATDISAMGSAVLGDGRPPMELHTVAGSRPVLGQTFQMEVSNVPLGTPLGIGVIGITKIDPGFDLTGVGLEGCFLYTTLDITQLLFPTGTPAPWPLFVPNDPAFAGVHLFAQAAMFAAGFTSSGIIGSSAGELVLDVL